MVESMFIVISFEDLATFLAQRCQGRRTGWIFGVHATTRRELSNHHFRRILPAGEALPTLGRISKVSI